MRRDVYLKTKAIFEEITGNKIYVTFKNLSGAPFVERLSNKAYMIHFPVQNEEDLVDPYRSFEHEISHILFTDFDVLIGLRERSKKYNDPRVPMIVHYVANIIEDLRIDLLWDQIYKGSRKRRMRQLQEVYKKTLATTGADILRSPVNILQFARYNVYGLDTSGYEKLLNEKEKKFFDDFVEILEKVKNKGSNATVIATEAILERLLKEFDQNTQTPVYNKLKSYQRVASVSTEESEENEEETDEDSENIQQLTIAIPVPSSVESSEEEPEEAEEVDEDTDEGLLKTEAESGDVDEEEEGEDEDDLDEFTDVPLEQVIKNTLSKLSHIDDDKLSNFAINSVEKTYVEDEPESRNINEKKLGNILKQKVGNIENSLDESEKEIEQFLKEIKKKIQEFDPQKKKDKPAYYKIKGLYYSSVPLNVRINQSVVKKLTLLFQQIKFKYHRIIDEEGYDIDIDAYIQERFTKGSRIFKRYDRTSGSTVYFLIDLSGSMDSILEEELVALLIMTKALKKTGFKVRIFGFSEENKDLRFEEIPEDKILFVRTLTYTPTHRALEQMYNIIKKDNNPNKILILITDGIPTTDHSPDLGFVTFPDGKNVRKIHLYTKNNINRLEKICKVYTLFITDDLFNTQRLKWIFSKNFYIVDREKLGNELVKFVRNIIIRDIKRR